MAGRRTAWGLLVMSRTFASQDGHSELSKLVLACHLRRLHLLGCLHRAPFLVAVGLSTPGYHRLHIVGYPDHQSLELESLQNLHRLLEFGSQYHFK